jgi:hypothetical protein
LKGTTCANMPAITDGAVFALGLLFKKIEEMD